MKAYTEKEIMDMGPEQLTSLLYEAFQEKLKGAIKANDEKDYIAVNYLLQGCNDILHRLGAGINYKAGIIADQLEALYNFSAEELIEANKTKDKKRMLDVLAIIENLAEAWESAVETAGEEGILDERVDSYENHLYDYSANIDIKD